MRRQTDEAPDAGGHDGSGRTPGEPPVMRDGRRRGLLSGMVDGFARLPVGFRLFLALLALMSVLAMLAS